MTDKNLQEATIIVVKFDDENKTHMKRKRRLRQVKKNQDRINKRVKKFFGLGKTKG